VLSSSAVFTKNTPVSIACGLVSASGAVAFTSSIRTHQGAAESVIEVRVIAIVFVLAIAIVLGPPGRYPSWMRIEQIVCAAFLLAIVVTTFLGRRRTTAYKIREPSTHGCGTLTPTIEGRQRSPRVSRK
jgi:hypothetical protein